MNMMVSEWMHFIVPAYEKFPLARLTGPVRGIDFHSNQPLFVSGGDDYKIKVCLVLQCTVYVAPPTPVGAWSMALGLRQRIEYYCICVHR